MHIFVRSLLLLITIMFYATGNIWAGGEPTTPKCDCATLEARAVQCDRLNKDYKELQKDMAVCDLEKASIKELCGECPPCPPNNCKECEASLASYKMALLSQSTQVEEPNKWLFGMGAGPRIDGSGYTAGMQGISKSRRWGAFGQYTAMSEDWMEDNQEYGYSHQPQPLQIQKEINIHGVFVGLNVWFGGGKNVP